MASLYKRGSGADAVWWGRLTIAGRQHRRSMRTSHRATAKERLKAWQTELESEVRFGIVERSWDEALLAFVTDPPEDLSPSTLKRYEVSYRAVHDILSGKTLAGIGKGHLNDIAGRAGVTNATRRRDLTAVSAVLKYAVRREWLDDNPIRRFDRGTIKERRDPIVLPPEGEVERFIAAAHESVGADGRGTLGYLVRTLELTGMRLEEAGALKWAEVDLARGAIQLTKTKRRRARAIELDSTAVRTLSAVPRALKCEHVFWHGPGLRYRNLSSRLARLRGGLEIAWETHVLRHLYAVRYMRDGGSIYKLQKQLGHRSIETTERYLDYLTPTEQVAARRLTGTES